MADRESFALGVRDQMEAVKAVLLDHCTRSGTLKFTYNGVALTGTRENIDDMKTGTTGSLLNRKWCTLVTSTKIGGRRLPRAPKSS